MTHNKLNRELEIECWREKRERVNDELEQLQAAMVADTTIWNQDNTTRCATLIGNLRYTDSKLKVSFANEIVAFVHPVNESRNLAIMVA